LFRRCCSTLGDQVRNAFVKPSDRVAETFLERVDAPAGPLGGYPRCNGKNDDNNEQVPISYRCQLSALSELSVDS
jgi:hypothetical protein